MVALLPEVGQQESSSQPGRPIKAGSFCWQRIYHNSPFIQVLLHHTPAGLCHNLRSQSLDLWAFVLHLSSLFHPSPCSPQCFFVFQTYLYLGHWVLA